MASGSAAELAEVHPELKDYRGRQVVLVFANQGLGNMLNTLIVMVCFWSFGISGYSPHYIDAGQKQTTFAYLYDDSVTRVMSYCFLGTQGPFSAPTPKAKTDTICAVDVNGYALADTTSCLSAGAWSAVPSTLCCGTAAFPCVVPVADPNTGKPAANSCVPFGTALPNPNPLNLVSCTDPTLIPTKCQTVSVCANSDYFAGGSANARLANSPYPTYFQAPVNGPTAGSATGTSLSAANSFALQCSTSAGPVKWSTDAVTGKLVSSASGCASMGTPQYPNGIPAKPEYVPWFYPVAGYYRIPGQPAGSSPTLPRGYVGTPTNKVSGDGWSVYTRPPAVNTAAGGITPGPDGNKYYSVQGSAAVAPTTSNSFLLTPAKAVGTDYNGMMYVSTNSGLDMPLPAIGSQPTTIQNALLPNPAWTTATQNAYGLGNAAPTDSITLPKLGINNYSGVYSCVIPAPSLPPVFDVTLRCVNNYLDMYRYDFAAQSFTLGAQQALSTMYGVGAILCLIMVLYRFVYLDESKMFAEERKRIEAKLVAMGTPMVGTGCAARCAVGCSCQTVDPDQERRNTLAFCLYWPRQFAASWGWFINDFAFYGNKLQQGAFIKILFTYPGQSAPYITPAQVMCWTALNSFIALTGYYVAAALIDKEWYGRKNMQNVGFVAMFVIYIVIYAQWQYMNSTIYLPSGIQWFQALYYLSTWFQQFGPNATTWLVAGEIFPTAVRTTNHGIAAAWGKAGAIIASVHIYTITGQPIGDPNPTYVACVSTVPKQGQTQGQGGSNCGGDASSQQTQNGGFTVQYGTQAVFLISAIWAAFGVLATWMWLPETTGLDLAELDKFHNAMMDGHPEDYNGEAVNPKHLSPWEKWVMGWHKNYLPPNNMRFAMPCEGDEDCEACDNNNECCMDFCIGSGVVNYVSIDEIKGAGGSVNPLLPPLPPAGAAPIVGQPVGVSPAQYRPTGTH